MEVSSMRHLKVGMRTPLRPYSLLRGLGLGGLLAFALVGSAHAATTINWRFYDFFNVPPGEWWDARLATYFETPIGAECQPRALVAKVGILKRRRRTRPERVGA
jgi:hypothetical protein